MSQSILGAAGLFREDEKQAATALAHGLPQAVPNASEPHSLDRKENMDSSTGFYLSKTQPCTKSHNPCIRPKGSSPTLSILHLFVAVEKDMQTGTIWTCVAHIITAVIGSGVLSLAWSTSQLGWIAGPVSMLCFAIVTFVSAFLLSDCYRSPHPVTGTRNYSYMDAVRVTLGSLP
ncbi:hypothetical protein GW17_00029253 [Ensete ventricosum]|nr:hypothetical protein GW17_00029253 [Ensete ventricosum]